MTLKLSLPRFEVSDMSIQTEINRIVAAKEAIVAALTEKGVSVGGGRQVR